MVSMSGKSVILAASLQALVALGALASSPAAAITAASIGVLAVGRYAAMAAFASSLGSGRGGAFRVMAMSAWLLGLAALVAAMAAVAIKYSPQLPWAVAAAFAGPLGFSALALVEGFAGLASRRAGHPGGSR
jgi:hypothetical protein